MGDGESPAHAPRSPYRLGIIHGYTQDGVAIRVNSFNKLLMQGQVFFSFRLEQISLFGDAVSTPSPN